MTRLRRAAALSAVLLAALSALAFLTAAPAAAAIDGPCAIQVQGVDAGAGDARVQVPDNGSVTYRITSTSPVVHWVVKLHYGPFSIPVLDQQFPDDGGLVRAGATSVAGYTKYGTGLYEVTGDAQLADGTTCHARMELAVAGSPFTSVLGIVALSLIGAGALGLLALIIQVLLQVNDVRAAVADFVTHAREAKEQAVQAAAGGPHDEAREGHDDDALARPDDEAAAGGPPPEEDE